MAFYRTGRAASLSRGHRQMLQDGLVVIRRGVERLGSAAIADWRLPATYLALWCAAAEAGAGATVPPCWNEVAPDPLLDNDWTRCAKPSSTALSVGAAVVPAPWPRRGLGSASRWRR